MSTGSVIHRDLVRLYALLERLEPREHEPCGVEECHHCGPLALSRAA